MAESIIKNKIHFGTRIIISLPYTAETDGIITTLINPSTASSAYSFFTIGGEHVFRVSSANGVTTSGSAPIRKGEQIVQYQQSNIKSQNVFFVPFI